MTFKQIFRRFGFSAILLIAGLAFLITGIIKIVNVNTYPQTTAVITYVNYEEGIGVVMNELFGEIKITG